MFAMIVAYSFGSPFATPTMTHSGSSSHHAGFALHSPARAPTSLRCRRGPDEAYVPGASVGPIVPTSVRATPYRSLPPFVALVASLLLRLARAVWPYARKLGQDIKSVLLNDILGYARRSFIACEIGSAPWIWAFASLGFLAWTAASAASAAAAQPAVANLQGSYWLARIISLRWLSFVQFVAFAVALNQNRALVGEFGILPARCLLDRADAAVDRVLQARSGSDPIFSIRRTIMRVEKLPTVLWFAENRRGLDLWLECLALAGLVVSAWAFVVGGATAWQLLAVWILYHSINAVGQRWYSFGWEAQLLETTLLALLAAPSGLLGCTAPGAAFPTGAPPPALAPWAFRWLAFRIMLGAGLIKVRGAKCWLDLTAMCHHLETQPIPNPLTRYFHNLPRQVLLYATACNHVIELFVPWLVLFPWRSAQVAFGTLHIVFQLSLILTGNLSFLNWLTIVPAFWCFDDATLAGLLPPAAMSRVVGWIDAAAAQPPVRAFGPFCAALECSRDVVAFTVLVWLSIPVYRNLLGPRGGEGKQKMNAAFERKIHLPLWLLRTVSVVKARIRRFIKGGGIKVRFLRFMRGLPARAEETPSLNRALPQADAPTEGDKAPIIFDLRALRLLNTYGAFGSVNLERIEIVFEGSRGGTDDKEWQEYTFKAAVDDPYKRPAFCAPYHYRLDWCRWIASCRGRRAQGLDEPWVIAFVARLLQGYRGVRGLLAKGGDPFEGEVPTQVRARLYSYKFALAPTSPADPYWQRVLVGEYLPPLSLADAQERLQEMGLKL